LKLRAGAASDFSTTKAESSGPLAAGGDGVDGNSAGPKTSVARQSRLLPVLRPPSALASLILTPLPLSDRCPRLGALVRFVSKRSFALR
jgi:hypothetical protein